MEKGKGGTKIQCKERKDNWRDAEQQQRHAKQGEEKKLSTLTE